MANLVGISGYGLFPLLTFIASVLIFSSDALPYACDASTTFEQQDRALFDRCRTAVEKHDLATLRVLADGGYPPAEAEYAAFLMSNGPLNNRVALSYLQKSARGGSPFGMYQLGRVYEEDGLGGLVPPDEGRGAALIADAAAAGNTMAKAQAER